MRPIPSQWPWGRLRRTLLYVAGALALLAIAALGLNYLAARPPRAEAAPAERGRGPDPSRPGPPIAKEVRGVVHLTAGQQAAVGLKTARVEMGYSHDVLRAPGRVAPDETHYAFIAPRASGVVRAVAAHIGQDVKAGDLLATIDSPEVAQARLELVTRLIDLQVARTQLDWQEAIYATTMELIEHLKKEESPEKIHERFEGRPVGVNRERLMTAYAQFLLDRIRFRRNKELKAGNAISLAKFQEVQAEFEASQATYQSLMDRMGFENKLAKIKAEQDHRQAETSVQVARERLRVLGVKPDGTEPPVESGKVVGVKPDGTLPPSPDDRGTDEAPEQILEKQSEKDEGAVAPVGAQPEAPVAEEKGRPISTFSMWAPFDGTILDRALIVPGVAIEKAQKIYTLANLKTVWIETHVQESDFDELIQSREAEIRFSSPAYPGRVFQGQVIYSGDLVDEKTRSVLLLARAKNPDRALKPGMFVEVEVVGRSTRPAAMIPRSALLTEDDRQFVYVKTGREKFERREVSVGQEEGDRVAVLRGLNDDEEVVVEGGFKLKAEDLGPDGGG